MQMLYNSDNFAVVRFDSPALPQHTAADTPPAATPPAATPPADAPSAGVTTPAADTRADTQDGAAPLPQDMLLARGGYEIVDKFARKEIFLEGAMAQHFKEGVEALIKTSPSEEELDEFIGRFAQLAQQPVVLH